ncbi:MAG TPA: hypothetical protein VHZ55_22825, partial [Bryobacteraceae bacterium]|nr:hypothetical protein [Bryobacteraceae bacterium]
LQGDAEAKRRLADAAKTNAENKRAAAKQALGKIKPPDGVGPVAPALGGSGVTTGRLPYPTVQDHSPFDKHKGTKPPWQK